MVNECEVGFRADRLAELMKKRKYNDSKLAKYAHVSRSQVFYMRKGQRKKISSAIVARIADQLKTSMQYLIGETDDPSPNQRKVSAVAADIATTAEELNEEYQRVYAILGDALKRAQEELGDDTDEDLGTDMSVAMALLRVFERKLGESEMRSIIAADLASDFPDLAATILALWDSEEQTG